MDMRLVDCQRLWNCNREKRSSICRSSIDGRLILFFLFVYLSAVVLLMLDACYRSVWPSFKFSIAAYGVHRQDVINIWFFLWNYRERVHTKTKYSLLCLFGEIISGLLITQCLTVTFELRYDGNWKQMIYDMGRFWLKFQALNLVPTPCSCAKCCFAFFFLP